MKTRFNWELRDNKQWMKDNTDDEEEYLCLAVACLALTVKYESVVDGSLNSFGWFAAGIVVPRLLDQQDETFSNW